AADGVRGSRLKPQNLDEAGRGDLPVGAERPRLVRALGIDDPIEVVLAQPHAVLSQVRPHPGPPIDDGPKNVEGQQGWRHRILQEWGKANGRMKPAPSRPRGRSREGRKVSIALTPRL